MERLVVYPLLALALIWIGYPLAIRLLGALRRPEVSSPPRPADERVSIILASADDAQAIRNRVTDLLATQYPAQLIEVVVALDAANAKATPDDLGALDERVRVVIGDAPGGKATALNAAVRAASHDLLVFADTAQRFDPDAIPVLIDELTSTELGAVSGMLELPGKDGSLNLAERYWRYERWLRRWEGRLRSGVGVTGAIYAMHRSLWQPLPTGLLLDDLYVPMRLVLQGKRVGFTEKARAHDLRRFAPEQEYRRKMRTLTGVLQVCAWLPGVLNPLRNPLWVQFVFHKLLRLLTPYLAFAAASALAWTSIGVLLSRPTGVLLLAILVAAVAVLCLIPGVRAAVKQQIAWGIALQSSIIVATANGVRRRWDVWR